MPSDPGNVTVFSRDSMDGSLTYVLRISIEMALFLALFSVEKSRFFNHKSNAHLNSICHNVIVTMYHNESKWWFCRPTGAVWEFAQCISVCGASFILHSSSLQKSLFAAQFRSILVGSCERDEGRCDFRAMSNTN